MVNASQRVIFDPAGTIKHDIFIEQDDVLYGVTPSVLELYTRAYARQTHHGGFVGHMRVYIIPTRSESPHKGHHPVQ